MIVEAELSYPGFTVRIVRWQWTRPFEYDWYPPFYNLALMLSYSLGESEGSFRVDRTLNAFARSGSLIFTPADTCLPVRSPPCTLRCVIAEFDRNWFEDVTDIGHYKPSDMLSPCLDVKHPQLTQSLLNLASEAHAPGRASMKFAEGIATQTAIYAARYLESAASEIKSSGQLLSPWQMRRIVEYVEDMPGYMPDIVELAGLCGVCDRHLRRLFKQTTGQTISEYARDAWVAKAKWLLANTALGLKQVAARMGFTDPSSFATSFRKTVGVTPKVFRQQGCATLTH